MVVTEENANALGGKSLADQLIEQDNPAKKTDDYKPKDSVDSIPLSQETEDLDARIEGVGDTSSTVNLLDDSDDLSGVLTQKPAYAIKKYNTGFILSVLGIFIFGGLTYLAYCFYQYLDLKSEPIIPTDKIEKTQKTSDIYDSYGQTLGLFDLLKYENFSLVQQGLTGAKDLIQDDSLNFVQKKDILEISLSNLGKEIISLRQETKDLRENMNKDGFFPQELVSILKEENVVSSIQRSLLSLEVVKFSSAMKVFSLMDVFVSSMADNLGYTKSDIKEKLSELIARGERDVEYYLNVCYNNPYEPVKCDKVDDFNNYYKKILGDKDFDTSFFKILMEFINNNLEYSNMPSFSITFNSFDGKSNSIGFTIEVNTLKEDEYALIQQGIKSPHIFIVSELIKLLKQSTFIVGKAIDAKDIKVNPKQVTIGGSKYIVNNSIKNFNLPIQKSMEREIFDFVDSYTTNVLPFSDNADDRQEFDTSSDSFTGNLTLGSGEKIENIGGFISTDEE